MRPRSVLSQVRDSPEAHQWLEARCLPGGEILAIDLYADDGPEGEARGRGACVAWDAEDAYGNASGSGEGMYPNGAVGYVSGKEPITAARNKLTGQEISLGAFEKTDFEDALFA